MSTTKAARPRLTDARLYQTLRTAHLERAHELSPASIVYRTRRYDFDEQLTEGLDLVQAEPVAAAVALARSGVTRLEINEPLMLSSLPATVLALAGLAIRRLIGGPRTLVVTYVIGNADPFAQAPPGRGQKPRLRRRLERIFARMVWRRVDRVVFGSDDARAVYRAVLGSPTRAEQTLIPALPARYPGATGELAMPGSVVFVGALMPRKGVQVLLAAWPLVRQAAPDARLRILGKGLLEDEVRQALASPALDGTVTLEVDPSRERIHDALEKAQVLTLPSQPSPTWREQIGLPIVEGLSHGCTVVTTDETALADWLRDHGHSVSVDATSAEALADALLAALSGGPSRSDVLASLPARDSRLEADDWLFREDAP